MANKTLLLRNQERNKTKKREAMTFMSQAKKNAAPIRNRVLVGLYQICRLISPATTLTSSFTKSITAWLIIAGASYIDRQGALIQHLPLKHTNRFFCLSLIVHFDKAKTF